MRTSLLSYIAKYYGEIIRSLWYNTHNSHKLERWMKFHTAVSFNKLQTIYKHRIHFIYKHIYKLMNITTQA